MAIVTTNGQHYQDIAAAIREKTGLTDVYLPAQMAAAIQGLSVSSLQVQAGKISCGAGTKSLSLNIGLESPVYFVLFAINAPTYSTTAKGHITHWSTAFGGKVIYSLKKFASSTSANFYVRDYAASDSHYVRSGSQLTVKCFESESHFYLNYVWVALGAL